MTFTDEDALLIFNRFDDVHKLHFTGCRLTIGRFQGVHLGHRHLIAQLGENDPRSPKVVVTFDPPPEDVLAHKIHPKIANSEEKIKLLEELGVDVVFVVPFDEQVANLPAEDFARQYIVELFRPKLIAVGYDFAFGKNRTGNTETFKAVAPKGTRIVHVGPLKNKDEIVSTSLIRTKILAGDVRRAAELLARPYPLHGVVMDGAKRGRSIGFPTINLKFSPNRVLPREGVYAVTVDIEGETFNGVCNVGFNPTFMQDHQVKVECYILDFDRDVYHKSVTLNFIERIRDEKRFTSREELIRAIENDVVQARRIFLPLSKG